MSTSETDGGEGVIDRKLILCPMLSSLPTEDLIRTCEVCNRFFVFCCHCNNEYRNDGRRADGSICHHFRLIFTDGACRLNGQDGAAAGVGIACGEGKAYQLSLPITDQMDPEHKRTSQRAELLAALSGLRYLGLADGLNHGDENKGSKKENHRNSQERTTFWVIATDSEYVVKGMTEWLPVWKANNYRNNRNKEPANLDLFMFLDRELSAQERKNKKVKIGFWHVLREFNTIADRLAKEASLDRDRA